MKTPAYSAATFVFTVFLCFGMHMNETRKLREENRVLRLVNSETIADMKYHSQEYASAAEIHEWLSSYTTSTENPGVAGIREE